MHKPSQTSLLRHSDELDAEALAPTRGARASSVVRPTTWLGIASPVTQANKHARAPLLGRARDAVLVPLDVGSLAQLTDAIKPSGDETRGL